RLGDDFVPVARSGQHGGRRPETDRLRARRRARPRRSRRLGAVLMRPRVASRVALVTGVSSLLALVAVSPACNWGSFADEARNAPVRSIGAPDSFKSQDFGRLL